jgi:hypothetical protein
MSRISTTVQFYTFVKINLSKTVVVRDTDRMGPLLALIQMSSRDFVNWSILNILVAAQVCIVGSFFGMRSRVYPMFSSQREDQADSEIVALVELDMKKLRVRIVLRPEAIRERLRDLEDPVDYHAERQRVEDTTDKSALDKMSQQRQGAS